MTADGTSSPLRHTSFRRTRLRQLLAGKIVNGFSPPSVQSSHDKVSPLRVLKLNAIQPFTLNSAQSKAIPHHCHRSAAAHTIQKGTFLISRAGNGASIGRCVLVRQSQPNLTYPDLMMCFRIDTNQMEPEFLELCLQCTPIRDYLLRQATGTNSSMAKLTQNAVLNIPLLLPPLAMQQQLLPLIRSLRQALLGYTRLEQLQGRLFRHAEDVFSRRIALIDTQPEKWEQRPISQLFHHYCRRGTQGQWLAVSKGEGVSPRRSQGGPSVGKMVRPGDFVVSLRASEGGLELVQHVGRLSPAYTVLRPRVAMVPNFYRFYFKSPHFIERTLRLAISSTRGDGRVNWHIFKTLPVYYPSIHDQTEIAGLFLSLCKQRQILQDIHSRIVDQLAGLSDMAQSRHFPVVSLYDPRTALVGA